MEDDLQNLNMKGITADRLRTVYYVACTQSATKAGEYLGLSQSAVTKQIQMIEEEIGVLIFHRTDRKFTLTSIGHKIFDLANRTLHDIDGVLKSIKEEFEGTRGILRVLTYPSFGTIMVPKFFSDFNQHYPNITLQIMTTFGEMSIMDADVIIRAYIANQPELEQLRLFQENYGIYAHQSYLDKHDVPQTLEDLDHHQLLALDPMLEKIYPQLNWVLKAGVAEHAHYRRAHMYLPTSDVLGAMVMRGCGVASLVHYQARIIDDGGLVRLLPSLGIEKEYICLSFNKHVKNQERYVMLYRFLKEKIDREPHIFDNNE